MLEYVRSIKGAYGELGLLLKLLSKKEYFVCPNCHEHYEFNHCQVKSMIKKYGHLHCYYCQTELKRTDE